MSDPSPKILCIGSVLWDVIGRSASAMRQGSDVPGRITRIPGGVALNIAITLARMGLKPALLSAVGRDAEGDELLAQCATLGLETRYVYRSDDLPTDRYMAVEGANGLIAAIADAHSLEAAGRKILLPLENNEIGSTKSPYSGTIALDGNLTANLLDEIAHDPILAHADLRIAPASPGKAERLLPFINAQRGTLYVNLEEANILCNSQYATAPEAAQALIARGAQRALVTNGGEITADATAQGVTSACPPKVLVTRVTGAGDTFMAAHICADLDGQAPSEALHIALRTAAAHVSGDTSL